MRSCRSGRSSFWSRGTPGPTRSFCYVAISVARNVSLKSCDKVFTSRAMQCSQSEYHEYASELESASISSDDIAPPDKTYSSLFRALLSLTGQSRQCLRRSLPRPNLPLCRTSLGVLGMEVQLAGRPFAAGCAARVKFRDCCPSHNAVESFRFAQLVANKACIISAECLPAEMEEWEGIVHFVDVAGTRQMVQEVQKDVQKCQTNSYALFKERFAPARLLNRTGFEEKFLRLAPHLRK
ncbi:unnamed protein product [Prorocentrum cordatum]|uniref:Uncharacterized protein n=1 Tax=Prorocentrum cordatum TaxID=2364126 RepID=A0ABN9PAY3_9DINO|nr:unnamed protein product [Polarella glacialis]